MFDEAEGNGRMEKGLSKNCCFKMAMLTLLATMSYATNPIAHFDFCNTFEVLASGESIMERHTSEHSGWEIVFLPPKTNLIPQMEIRGKSWQITPDSLLVYNGEEVHTEVYGETAQGTHRIDALVITEDFLQKLLRNEGVSARELLFDQVKIKASPRMLSLLRAMMEFRRHPTLSPFSFDCLATEIAVELISQQKNSFSEKLKLRSSSGHFPSNLMRAKKLMAERVLDPTLSVDDVAQAAGLSKFHFIRSFRQNVGSTPRHYLNSLRIDLAQNSLARGKSVLDTALDSGFSSLSTFNKVFRRHTGRSPLRSGERETAH